MKKFLLALLLIFFASDAWAANRYWVGGGSSTNWNATGNTNWSTTSGGANNASVPGTSDFVYFDSNSGTGTANISASISVLSVDATGYAGTWTQANSTTLTVASAGLDVYFILSSGMTYAPSAASQAVAIGSGNSGTITTAGHTLGNLTLTASSAGVTATLQDALTLRADATLTFTSGNFNANGYSVTTGVFSSSNSNTRVLSLGNGLWTLNGGCANSTPWNTATTTNLTFNKGASNLVFQFCSGFQGLRTFASGGLTFNDVTFNSTAASPAVLTWTGSPTFATATFDGPLVVLGQSGTIAMNATQFAFDTTNGPIALIGQGATGQYMYFSQASGTITMDKVSLYDTNWSFAGSPTVTATNSYDLKGNVGVTITAPSGGGGTSGYIIGGN